MKNFVVNQLKYELSLFTERLEHKKTFLKQLQEDTEKQQEDIKTQNEKIKEIKRAIKLLEAVDSIEGD